MVSQDGSMRQENSKPRRTVDLQALNVHASRETDHTQSLFHQARSVLQGTLKTVCDAWNGTTVSHYIKMTYTFITPWGRY